MKANPGGQIGIDYVFGRDDLIAMLWDTLDVQSVIMTAERRIGKTSIIRKMQAQPPNGWVPVLQDLEQYHSADEFAVSVYEAVRKFLGTKHKAMQGLLKVWKSLGGTEIGGILKLPPGLDQGWKILLTGTIENLVQNQAKNRLVFFWDEMPYMLDSISKRESEEIAIAVLDVLRSYRQTHEDLRMVITGSIGLHHVITKLKDTNYKNEPLNDLYTVEVPPLAPSDAEHLAKTLIQGEKLDTPDIDDSATVIAVEGDYFPYYIHHIVRFLKTSGKQVNSETIRKSIQQQLVDSNDPWELGHFRDRVPLYYPQDAELVFAILDCLASQDNHIDVDSIFADIKSQIEFNDRNHLLKILRLLESDHYLKRDLEGNYLIRFPLIQRWWRLDRGL